MDEGDKRVKSKDIELSLLIRVLSPSRTGRARNMTIVWVSLCALGSGPSWKVRRYEGKAIVFCYTSLKKDLSNNGLCFTCSKNNDISIWARAREQMWCSIRFLYFFTSTIHIKEAHVSTSSNTRLTLFFIQFFSIKLHKDALHVRLEYILTTNKIRGFNFLQSLCAKVICNVRTFNDTIYLVASVAVWFT